MSIVGSEPGATALLLAILGVLMALSVVASRLAGRLSVPVALLFLVIGMLAGSEGVGGIHFENYALSFRLGTISLVLILFDGGLNTSFGAVKRAVAPATVLATAGVIATSAVLAAGAHFLIGVPWPAALLLGAVVSSTDSAAVFAVLRGSGVSLGKRVATTLELESGLNDPLAMILTLALTAMQIGHRDSPWHLAAEVVVQLVLGVAGGAAMGFGARTLLTRIRPTAAGLWPVFTVAVALATFGGVTLIGGSGFLATYTAAIIIGNSGLPYRSGLLSVHDGLAWLCQVIMFLVFGLLSHPSRLWAAGGEGLVLGLVLALVARPLSTVVCLLPFGFRLREVAYIGWIGLRGAVPITLAMYPVLVGAPNAHRVFDLVFFIVVVNALIPGSTVRWVTRWLRMQVDAPPAASAVLEIVSTRPLHSRIQSFYIDAATAVAGARLAEVPFPEDAAVMLIVRGEELLPARGDSLLLPGDHVYVFCRPEDRATVSLLFGREES